MVKRKNRLMTDALREVWNTRSRFFSLFILALLAVCFLSGLRTTSPNMKHTADQYFDELNLMDGRVLSTLGLTDEDLAALAEQPGISVVEGAWNIDVVCGDKILSVNSMPEQINLPSLISGRLPQAADECVTEQGFLDTMGLEVGDTLTIDLRASDAEDMLVRDTFTIVGTVESPMYISIDRGSSSLGTGQVSAFMLIPEENFDLDYYTVAYFTVDGMAELDCYGDEYEDSMEAFLEDLEGFADERAALRYADIIGDAQAELDDARVEYEDAKAEVEQELADAGDELADARAELDDGWAEYYDGERTLEQETADARAELRDAREQLEQGELDYQDGLTQYNDAVAALADGQAELDEQRTLFEEQKALLDEQWAQFREQKALVEEQIALLESQQAEVDAGYAQYEAALAQYPVGSPYYAAVAEQLAPQKAQLDAAQLQLDMGLSELQDAQLQLDAGEAQLNAAQAEVDAGEAQLNAAQAELDDGRKTLADTAAQLDEARAELDDGWAEYEDGLVTLERETANARAELDDAYEQLTEGETEYADGLLEYEDGKAEADTELADALEKLNDAQAEIDDIEECEWYVLGRNTLSGYVTYGSDSERMSNLADVFPIIFFLVAALACLTTMTRMVEEQRTQIGCMKALGFTRRAISIKYIGYAFAASFFGGLVGAVLGCLFIPWVIYNAWGIMYDLPKLNYLFQPGICALAILAAVACTVGASLAACLSTLTDTPANLMRPKAPKAGKRVLLERVTPLWRRMKFIQKVTVRNLLRYKRRFWMTVIGIGGCTALIVTGFGLHNSIFDILDKQYDEITPYDASVGLNEDITADELSAITGYLDSSDAVTGYFSSYQTSVDVTSDASVVDAVNLFAVDDMEAFTDYVTLRHREDGSTVTMPEEGVVITEKLSELLEVSVGDTITIDGDRRVDVTVGEITENYVYHYIYLTEDVYEEMYGERPVHNALMLRYGQDSDEISDQVSTALMKLDGVSAYTHVAFVRDTFTDSMAAIDYAVIIIILAAAALAFVVLYNLTNINITERRRELATLKVLGFYDGEVSSYVYRENVFLTIIGIALGLFMGRWLHAWLVRTVEVNMVMFGRTAAPTSYLWAALMTVVFAVIVNIVAHFSLKKIDMVESLKTVE